ncbi:MAG: hypothetical protein AAGC60_19880 [Acidobacteriota bacterium]
MLATLAIALLAAVVSSLLTLGGAWWIYRHRVREQLERELEDRVRSALDDLGEVVEARVRRGVLDAVASLPSTELLADTTRTAARTGAQIVGAGLDTLLRGGRRRAASRTPDDE